MKTIPSGYDEGIDMSAIEAFSLVESICRRPGMFVADGGLREIIAWLEGYEAATRSAFGENSIPSQYDTSPTNVMDALATAVGLERNGMPIHHDLDRIIDHFGGPDGVIAAMKSIAERIRKAGCKAST